MDISQELHTIAGYSRDEAQRTGCYLISAEHLLLAILRLSDCQANRVLSTVCHDVDALKAALDRSIRTGINIPFEDADAITPDDEANNCMSLSVVEADKLGSPFAGSEHLLLSISRYASKSCRDILSSFGSSPSAIVSTILAGAATGSRRDGNPDQGANVQTTPSGAATGSRRHGNPGQGANAQTTPSGAATGSRRDGNPGQGANGSPDAGGNGIPDATGSRANILEEKHSARTGADPIHTPEPRHGTTGAAEKFLLNEMHRLAYDKSITPSKKSERS